LYLIEVVALYTYYYKNVCQSNACVQDLDMTVNAYVGVDSPGGLAEATGRTCDGGTLDREVFLLRPCTKFRRGFNFVQACASSYTDILHQSYYC
jgi:hypothetical protein